MKRLRVAEGSRPSLAAVLDVMLAPRTGLWRCMDVKSVLALARVCSAVRAALRAWLEAVVRDLSLGKEKIPVPVQLSPTAAFHDKLCAVAELAAFEYITAVQFPGGRDRHKLPPDLLTKQQNDDQSRRVARGRQVKVVVARCSGKGWGVLAAQPIEPRAFVAEYAGELVSTREVRRRYRELYDPRALNYVLSLREHARRPHGLISDVVRTNVDATRSGSLARLLNHSCAPNLEVAAVRVDSFVPRLALFARRRVEAGEELTFDYGGDFGAAGNAGIGRGTARPCRCGALECRGYLPSND